MILQNIRRPRLTDRGRTPSAIGFDRARRSRFSFPSGVIEEYPLREAGYLVGGLYGVSLGGVFFGESMFSRRNDASKVALVHLVSRLISDGFKLLDSQFMSSHMATFGAEEISRDEYHARLKTGLASAAELQPSAVGSGVAALEIIAGASRSSGEPALCPLVAGRQT
ncbi:hypothetical protein GGQ61_002585 [Phenylobacterium haematophilum]|uniref:Leucyl/phenylalanyl-tRNA--protein transferase n=1 Tax=Phenylobacterium haematophilum TaxID=98513 RepID=A0A840A3I3_9CAUL|nr:leucyl/phenylalanyl-tRNA--protein transferase [Phenylobacterium haematophilum]MBB3891857.1 hypothetical protein [Phenylobacterium haematophilum]